MVKNLKKIFQNKFGIIVVILNVLWLVYFIRFQDKVFHYNGGLLNKFELEVEELYSGNWVVESGFSYHAEYPEQYHYIDGISSEREAHAVKRKIIKDYWGTVNRYDPLNLRVLGSFGIMCCMYILPLLTGWLWYYNKRIKKE